MSYLLSLLVIAGIYAILAISLNLLVGYTGILSLSQGATFGVSAYTAALIATRTGMGIWVELLAAAAILAVFGAVVALGTVRMSGDYFLVASIALQFAISDLFTNLEGVTNGAAGIFGIPPIRIGGHEVQGDAEYSGLVWAAVAMLLVLSWRITSSPVGRVLRALRSDEVATASLGKSVSAHKIKATAVSGIFAAAAGLLYAHYVSFIDPTSFTVAESIFILTIVVIGGTGSGFGPVVGALVLLVGLPEVLDSIQIPDAVSAAVNQMIYGILLVAVALFAPAGMAGAGRAVSRSVTTWLADHRQPGEATSDDDVVTERGV